MKKFHMSLFFYVDLGKVPLFNNFKTRLIWNYLGINKEISLIGDRNEYR